MEQCSKQDVESHGKSDVSNEGIPMPGSDQTQRTWRFWSILSALCLINMATCLEGVIITTALPKISDVVSGRQGYIWIASSFSLAQVTVQPLFSQLSDLLGRRLPLIASLGIFILGAALSGGASSFVMLVVGRSVQGIGSGGLAVLVEIIICDMTPLQVRSKYLGIVMSLGALSIAVGPLLGGVFSHSAWRWVFFLPIPFCAAALLVITVLVSSIPSHKVESDLSFGKIDLVFGHLVFMASTCSVLLALTLGGTLFPWISYHILLPLVLGVLGWTAYCFYQCSNLCGSPVVSSRLIRNRTSVVALLLSFVAAKLLSWSMLWLPASIMALRRQTAFMSGVEVLPLDIMLIPSSVSAGAVMSKTGRYKLLHGFAFASASVGFGLLTILRSQSSIGLWIFFQLAVSLGLGSLMSTLLPAIQAGLPDRDIASSAGAFTFIRSLGFLWGMTLPSIIFKGQVDSHLAIIDDTDTRHNLGGGNAFTFISSGSGRSLSDEVELQVQDVYQASFQTIWYCAMAFALLGLFGVLCEEDLLFASSSKEEKGQRAECVREKSTG